jgi:hypothetical protein
VRENYKNWWKPRSQSTIAKHASSNWQHFSIIYFGGILCLPSFAKISSKKCYKRSLITLDVQPWREPTKEVTYIYCQILVNYYFNCWYNYFGTWALNLKNGIHYTNVLQVFDFVNNPSLWLFHKLKELAIYFLRKLICLFVMLRSLKPW